MVRAVPRRWGPRLRTLLVASAVLAIALLAIRYWPRPSLSESVPLSTAVHDDRDRLLRLTTAADQRYRLWMPLGEISPTLVDAVLLHEDAWFRWPSRRQSGQPGTRRVEYLRHRRGAHRRLDHHHATGAPALAARHAHGTGQAGADPARPATRGCATPRTTSSRPTSTSRPTAATSKAWARQARSTSANRPTQLTLPEALTLAVLPQAPSRRGRLSLHGGDSDAYPGAGLEAARARLYRALAKRARWRPVASMR